jgi:hypothetical protein
MERGKRMDRNRVRGYSIAFYLLALLLFLSRTGDRLLAATPSLSEDEIKAGFLLNFARFVTFPASSFPLPSSPLVICIVGDTPIISLLSDASAGKPVEGRVVFVKRLQPKDDFARCNILFIEGSQARYEEKILTSVKGASSLTVGESDTFMRAGGMIEFVVEDNRVKLELNLDTATAAGLKLSAKLIAVSRLVPVGSTGSK